MVSALVLCGIWAFGCGGDCNDPMFTTPSIGAGLQTSADGVAFADVTWEPSEGDILPDEYYGRMHGYPTEPVDTVETIAARELHFEFDGGLDSYLQDDGSVITHFSMPDTETYHDECDHVGQRDTYYVDLTLSFDASGELSGGSFSDVTASYGPCMSIQPGAPTEGGWALFLATAAAFVTLRRTRRPR